MCALPLHANFKLILPVDYRSDEAVRRLPTSKMYYLYAKFWMDVLYHDRKDSIALFQDAEFDASEFTASVLKVYENAESCGCLTHDLACQYVSFCLKLERLEKLIMLWKSFAMFLFQMLQICGARELLWK
jgi:hypothetical protein